MLIYPTIRHMRAFAAVARLRSFGQAADELCISHAALSQNISQLEGILQVKLIDRTTRSIALTSLGEQLFTRMERWLEEMEETYTEIQSQGKLSKGHVRVACLASVAIGLLSPAIEAFEKEHPGIRVSIRDDTGSGVEARVLDRAADFGIAGGAIRNPTLAFTPLFDEPYFLACPADHALAKKRKVTWAEVSGYDYIALGQETNIGQQLKSVFEETGNLPHIVHEFSQLGTVLGLVERGLGVSALPRSACPDHGRIEVVELTQPRVTRKVGTLTLRDRSLNPAAEAFYFALKRIGSDHSA